MMCNVIGREGSNWDSLYEDSGRRSSGRFGRRSTDSEKRFEPRALPFEESSASTKISDAPLCSFSSPAAILKASGPPTISPAHPEELRAVCNCKKSKCLKLYCQCFAAMMHCGENCNCNDCSNRVESESVSSVRSFCRLSHAFASGATRGHHSNERTKPHCISHQGTGQL